MARIILFSNICPAYDKVSMVFYIQYIPLTFVTIVFKCWYVVTFLSTRHLSPYIFHQLFVQVVSCK